MESKKAEQIKNLMHLKSRSSDTYEREHGKNKEKRYDKTGFCVATGAACHNLHDVLYLVNYSGIYGNSNVGSSMPAEFAKYFVSAVNEHFEQMVYRAIELIGEEAKTLVGDLKKEREEIDGLINDLEVTTG